MAAASIPGIVTEQGVFVARTVYAYRTTNGDYGGTDDSDPDTGEFTISGLNDDYEYDIVVLDDDLGSTYNALIQANVTPTPD